MSWRSRLLSAFGVGQQKDAKERSTVLEKNGNRLVAEFVTDAIWRTFTTVEEVTLRPPERMDFRHLSGPLQEAEETFTFTELEDGKTLWRHEGEFVLGWPVVGGSVGEHITRRWFDKVMVKHMAEMKESIEARAARSHVFRTRQTDEPERPG